MSVKQAKWPVLKKMLFAYLAISKILYWINNVMRVAQNDFESVGRFVITRLLTLDIFIIACVVLAYFIDKHVKNTIIQIVIAYAAFLGLIFIQGLVIIHFFSAGEAVFQIIFGLEFFVNFTITFFVVGIVMTIKDHMKKVENDTYKPNPSLFSAADEIAKLKILLDDEVITQEEFDFKKKELLGMKGAIK